MAQQPASEFLTIPELLRRSPVPRSESAVKRAIKSGRLKAQLVDGKYRVRPVDFAAYLTSSVVGGAA